MSPRLEHAADRMLRHNLNTGTGCREIARAIEQRTGQAAPRLTSGERRAAREGMYALELLKRKESRGKLTRVHEIRALWAVRPCWICGAIGQCEDREPLQDAAELGHPIPEMRIEPWMEVNS